MKKNLIGVIKPSELGTKHVKNVNTLLTRDTMREMPKIYIYKKYKKELEPPVKLPENLYISIFSLTPARLAVSLIPAFWSFTISEIKTKKSPDLFQGVGLLGEFKRR